MVYVGTECCVAHGEQEAANKAGCMQLLGLILFWCRALGLESSCV